LAINDSQVAGGGVGSNVIGFVSGLLVPLGFETASLYVSAIYVVV
jgi:hypothetical protein